MVNVVKDFKLIGISIANVFSITMHICQPRGDLVHWSPSKISSTRSKQQSPAAHHRDQQRSEQWKANQPSSSSPSLCKDVDQQGGLHEEPVKGHTDLSTQIVDNGITHVEKVSGISGECESSDNGSPCSESETGPAEKARAVLLDDQVALGRFKTNICDGQRKIVR